MKVSEIEQHSSFLGCFTQVFRTLVGPGLILISGVALVANRPPLGGAFDFVFGGAVLLTVLATLLEPRPSSPGPSEEAKPPFARGRYLLILLAASATLFCVAHFLIPMAS